MRLVGLAACKGEEEVVTGIMVSGMRVLLDHEMVMIAFSLKELIKLCIYVLDPFLCVTIHNLKKKG